MAAAAATTTLKVGSGITLVAQRDPIWLAKQVATVDALSAGRMLFGVGYGWNKEEMAHHGVAFGERRALLREKVLLMKQLWTQDEASFSGEFIHLDPSWAWPKPTEQPHPPIFMGGGAGPRTFAHIVEFCDGWIPLYGHHPIDDQIALLHRLAEDTGRDPATIEVDLFNAPRDKAKLAELAEMGVSRAIFGLPSIEPEAVLEIVERYAGLLP